jgi:hypothetical protein
MSAGPWDFKRVANPYKSLLKLRKSDDWVLSVAPRSQIPVSRLEARKPAIDVGACYLHRGADIDKGSGFRLEALKPASSGDQ